MGQLRQAYAHVQAVRDVIKDTLKAVARQPPVFLCSCGAFHRGQLSVRKSLFLRDRLNEGAGVETADSQKETYGILRIRNV
jgi:hypothetical protein